MSDFRTTDDQFDDVDSRYRRASALDESQPSEAVRRAVLAHARQLAAHAGKDAAASRTHSQRPDEHAGSWWSKAHRALWRPAAFGTLAAAALAGLLIAPHFLLPPRAQPGLAPAPESVSTPVPTPVPAQAAPGPAPPPAPALQSSTPSLTAHAVHPSDEALKRTDSPIQLKPSSLSARQSNPAARSTRAVPAPADAAIQDQGLHESAVVTSARRAASSAGMPAAAIAGPRSELANIQRDPAAALRQAATSGDVSALQASIDERADIESRDDSGRTALMLATLHGQLDAVKFLLAHGANPNTEDQRGTTPLQAAMAGDRKDIVEALKLAGAR